MWQRRQDSLHAALRPRLQDAVASVCGEGHVAASGREAEQAGGQVPAGDLPGHRGRHEHLHHRHGGRGRARKGNPP
eukprot:8424078-Lingulodinium_polyedra.AAC.1